MGQFIKKIWRIISDFAQAWAIFVWLVPAGAVSAVTAAFARAASVPPYLIMLYAAGAFCIISVAVAAIYHALLRRYEFIDKITAEGKIDYVQPHFAVDVKWSAKGVPLYIEKMNVGLMLRNLSRNSIDVKIVNFHAVVDGHAPNVDRYVGKILHLLPMAVNASQPDAIDLIKSKKLDVKGTLNFSLHYGLPGNLKYSIEKNQEFDFVVHQKHSIKPNPNIGLAVRDRA